MRQILLILSVVFFCIGPAPLLLAQPASDDKPQQTITLRDGSTIQGHLTNISNGNYTIENKTMGQVSVPASQVVSINAAGLSPSTPAMGNTATAPTVNGTPLNIMADPQIMSLMQELVKDPEVMELLKNPGLMQAAFSMDPQKIQNNPDVQKLMQNPKMQEILHLTAQKMQNARAANTAQSSLPQNTIQNR